MRRPAVADVLGPAARWVARHEHRILRDLARTVAGLGAAGLLVANPPVLSATDTVAAAGADAAAATPELIARSTPSTVFEGSTTPGREGVEDSARDLVASMGGLPTEPGAVAPWVRAGDLAVAVDRCAPADLVVSWTAPEGEYVDGAYVEPLGPVPSALTRQVNGVVLCRTSRHAFVGFEAAWERGRWRLSAVPSLDEETSDPLLAGEEAAVGATPVDASGGNGSGAGGALAGLPPATAWTGLPLEALAPYLPQTGCDPTAKPGVLGFRDLLLATYPSSRNLGIGRVCEAEGVSEHKEGRAFDWGVHADDPAERAAAEEVLAWMLGPDENGEPHAIARRLGLMYVIWDGQIWSSFLAAEGWRPYVGRSAHRDHIHFSFDWAGALAQSSFWQGDRAGVAAGSGAPDLPLAPAGPRPPMLPLPGLPALPAGPLLPPLFGEPAPSEGDAGAGGEPPPSTTTTTSPPSTTTTTAPPAEPEPEPTTTTTRPPLVTTPTTLRLGSL